MAYLALYREWRPKVFDEVVEQKHAVYALRQSVISSQIAHAYLFSGTRGTGKTTLAKIFARAINCLNPQSGNPCNQCAICRAMLDGSLMDVVEMDAASNNSVDNIRRICDEVVFMPAQARFKVYIIDEVHMLSTGAFNALLKTLEEPPAHAVFILATTEPHRIPMTILSRCQRYEFRRIPVASIVGRLTEIALADGIDASPEALQAIAGLADGAMRDAISLLDQARASFPGRISRDDILSLAGIAQDEFLQQMAQALLQGNAPLLIELVDQLVMTGRDLARFVTDLAQHFRNILVCQFSGNPQMLVRATAESLAAMTSLAGQIGSSQLIDLIKGLSALLADLRWASDARTALEIGLIRLMGSAPSQPFTAAAAASPAVQPAAETAAEPTPFEPAPPEWTAASAELAAPVETAVPAELEQQSILAPDRTEPAADTAAAQDLWKKILDSLLADGHMTLYLFSRSAQAAFHEGVLQLIFTASEQVNYQETNQPSARKLLQAAAARLSGRDMDVQPVQAAGAAAGTKPDASSSALAEEDDWIRKIKKTADTLGIPVKMEE